ncbi:MAG: tRNA-intron lyase [Nitrososphaeria archaeon]
MHFCRWCASTSHEERVEAELVEGNIIVWKPEDGRRLFGKGYYGKPLGVPKPKSNDFNVPLILDLIEAMYLLEKGLIKVTMSGQELSADEILSRGAQSYDRLHAKYLVYRDLREKGFIVTPGIKFGSDFAVYKQGPGIDHAPFMIQVTLKSDEFSAAEIVRSGRLATTVKKEFTVAVPDPVNEKVEYITFKWWKA